MAVSVNLDKILMKEYEAKSLDELVEAPVTALEGVSEGDAEHLKAAFNIKTVRRPGQEQAVQGRRADRRSRRGRRQVGALSGKPRSGPNTSRARLSSSSLSIGSAYRNVPDGAGWASARAWKQRPHAAFAARTPSSAAATNPNRP